MTWLCIQLGLLGTLLFLAVIFMSLLSIYLNIYKERVEEEIQNIMAKLYPKEK